MATLIWVAVEGPSPGLCQVLDPSAVTGRWSGTVAVMGAEIPFAVQLSLEGDPLSGTLEYPVRSPYRHCSSPERRIP